MAIIGFAINKIFTEKYKDQKGKVSVQSNINITDIKESTMKGLNEGQKALLYNFEFLADYQPEIGYVKLQGYISSVEETAEADKILDEWTKNGTINSELRVKLYNNAFNKCSPVALLVSRELKLPSPFPMPKVQQNTKKE